jgi:hypothetical protein
MLLGYECGNPREFLTANSESISTERNSIRFAIKDIALIISLNPIIQKTSRRLEKRLAVGLNGTGRWSESAASPRLFSHFCRMIRHQQITLCQFDRHPCHDSGQREIVSRIGTYRRL